MLRVEDPEATSMVTEYRYKYYYYLFNAQNDVIGLIDRAGNKVVSYAYNSWGAPLTTADSSGMDIAGLNQFRYRCYCYDEETGLYYVSSRYYDPEIGRFINAEDENGGKPVKVVANLPYYITTPIIMGLFENRVPVKSITVMVQKEVADRMQVGPGTKDYGALSLAVQYYAKPYIVANVPPNCFMPRPKVGSAVIRLEKYEKPPVYVKDERLMFRIIRASFNQRRKTLANGLKNSQELDFTKEEIEHAIECLGKGTGIRGETLTLEDFAKLSNLLGEMPEQRR